MNMTAQAIALYNTLTNGALDDDQLLELENLAGEYADADASQMVEEKHMRGAIGYYLGYVPYEPGVPVPPAQDPAYAVPVAPAPLPVPAQPARRLTLRWGCYRARRTGYNGVVAMLRNVHNRQRRNLYIPVPKSYQAPGYGQMQGTSMQPMPGQQTFWDEKAIRAARRAGGARNAQAARGIYRARRAMHMHAGLHATVRKVGQAPRNRAGTPRNVRTGNRAPLRTGTLPAALRPVVRAARIAAVAAWVVRRQNARVARASLRAQRNAARRMHLRRLRRYAPGENNMRYNGFYCRNAHCAPWPA